MTEININNYSSDLDLTNIKSVNFHYLGDKVYSAKQVDRLVGTFVSQPIQGDSSLVTWKELTYSAQKFENTDIYIYVRSSSSIAGLESANWIGPYLNSINDISVFKNIYLQFMVALIDVGAKNYNYQYLTVPPSPIFSAIDLTYLSLSNSAKFFTKAFNLNFTPKSLLLTYNGEISNDSIVKFAVSGLDSVSPSDYQYIDPNKIEDISELSLLSSKIKLMIEMVSDATIPAVIHEFALMFSGDQQLELNEESSESSESSSSMLYILLDPNEIWEVPPTCYSPILFEFTGDLLETATVILGGQNFVVGNIDNQFVWDVGGTNQHTFTYLGESVSQIANSIEYKITWNGFGSLLFIVKFLDVLSNSSSSSYH